MLLTSVNKMNSTMISDASMCRTRDFSVLKPFLKVEITHRMYVTADKLVQREQVSCQRPLIVACSHDFYWLITWKMFLQVRDLQLTCLWRVYKDILWKSQLTLCAPHMWWRWRKIFVKCPAKVRFEHLSLDPCLCRLKSYVKCNHSLFHGSQ